MAAALGAALGAILAALGRSSTRTDPSPSPAASTPPDVDALLFDDYRGAFFAAPDPETLLDARGRVLAVNEAARRAFGAAPTGADVSAFLRQPALLDAVAGTLADGAGRDVEFVQRGPTERWFSARVRAIASARADTREAERATRVVDGGLSRARLLVTLRDETRTRRAESLHRDFVANASHELKTPLAAFTGFVDTLLGPAADDPTARRRFLGIMRQQAHRMTRLVEDLLSLNRIELGEHLPPGERVDMARIARTVAARFPDAGDADGCAFDLVLPTEAPPTIGDATQLEQALENLMSNALKYGGPRRPRVRLADPPVRNGQLGLAVEDFGAGVAPDDVPRLTERFYRVDDGAAPGTGLGLAIVKHVMARHRGGLEIESALGRGSRFTLWTPLWTDAEDVANHRFDTGSTPRSAPATRPATGVAVDRR